MISAIFDELSLMPFIVWTTCATTWPPCAATSLAPRASWSACCALSAFCFTLHRSSSIDAAVCSSAEACSSVRDDRSLLPCAICVQAVATLWALPRTPPTTRTRPSRIDASDFINVATSSRPSAATCRVRSPAATDSAT